MFKTSCAGRDYGSHNITSGKNNFTLKKGAVATLEGFCSKDNNNYMIFKYNGQRGYIKLDDNQKDSFYGVSKRMVG